MERELFIKQLGQLVEIPTIREKERLEESSKALDLIESWVDKSINKKRFKNGKAEILLLGNGDLIQPQIGYLVHLDVVDGDEKLFKMSEDDGKLYGRGVSDMKYSIPIGIELLNRLSGDKKSSTVTVAITTDEEVGGGEGGAYLADVIKFKPQVLIVPDGGDGFVFVNKSKGVAHIWVESKGKTTHASRPWLGKNALVPIVKLANILAQKYEENSKVKNWNTTMNVGVLQGGKSTNQVCDQAVLKLDFRFPETRSVKEIFDEVKDLSEKIDPEMDVKLAASGDPTFTDSENSEVARFLNIAEKIIGKKIKVEGEEGASDARYWAKYNIPIIMMKPEGGGLHSENEWIDIESSLLFYKILEKYIKEYSIS